MRASSLVAALLLCTATPVLASKAVVSFSNGDPFPGFLSDETIGFVFTVSKKIKVSALGWYVFDGSLDASHQVGLWDSSGDLLTFTTIGAGNAPADSFVYNPVVAAVLTPGQYFVGGRDKSVDGDAYVTSVSDLVMGPRLTFVGSASSAGGSGFAFPSNINLVTTGGRFGPNFIYSIPEPASWTLMIMGFGAVGGALRRRRVDIAFAV